MSSTEDEMVSRVDYYAFLSHIVRIEAILRFCSTVNNFINKLFMSGFSHANGLNAKFKINQILYFNRARPINITTTIDANIGR